MVSNSTSLRLNFKNLPERPQTLCNLCKLLSIQTLSRHAVNFSLGLPRTGVLLVLIFTLVRAITQ